jgi:hypothetical protein
MEADAVAPKLNVKAAVTAMNITENRVSARLENTEE